MALLGEAEVPAQVLGDRARLGQVLARTSNGLRTTGDVDGESALQIQTCYRLRMESRGAAPIATRSCLDHPYLAQGDLESAIRVFEWGLDICRASGHRNSWHL
jgi:hypothetical protein